MGIYVIADIHGNLYKLDECLRNCPRNVKDVILLGDIGFGFFDNNEFFHVLSGYSRKNFIIVQGNHDNPGLIPEECGNVRTVTTKKGYRILTVDGKRCLFIPGAYSYDKDLRIMFNQGWWEDEECSEQDLFEMLDAFENDDEIPIIRHIFSHDAPLTSYLYFYEDTKISRTNHTLNSLLESTEDFETTWVHGHLHQAYVKRIRETTIIGLGADDAITLL